MRKILSILVLLTATLMVSCGIKNVMCTHGSGNVIKETRDVSNFKIISLATSGNVYVSQGDTESLTVECDDNLMAHIITVMEDGVLEIKTDKSLCYKKMNFYVTMKDVKGFKILGSGNIIGKTPVKSDDFLLKINGSGDMKFDSLTTYKTGILIQGSGNAKLNGKSGKCSIEINGSGNVLASDFSVDYLDMEINGSGDVKITAKKSLKAEVNGSGDVFYDGEPANVNIDIKGSGNVRKVSK